MEPMITPAPVPQGALLHRRDSSSSNSSGALDTCGYLSGDYGESDLQPPNTHSTDPTAPACITYSQPPPSSGSAADAGLSPTIFSYSCGPTQTTHIYLATATNAPASASSHAPTTISHLPIYAYVGIGIGGLLVLLLLLTLWRKCTNTDTSRIPYGQPNHPPLSPYRCRHCGSTYLTYKTVQPGNRNGNVGRPYYVCENPHCPNVTRLNAGQQDRGWVTWDDNIGVAPGNPLCKCLRSARQDTAGEGSGVPGRRFWTCSTGACHYTSWRLDGKESWGNGF
ncbi:hypothetical protein MMC28_003690 [Mycoblastus sanguinarius]|nr:hypothetical protein [Mycoblastus sanguinarius]